MSGTSFDGVDAAIIKTDGRYYIEKIEDCFVEYTKEERAIYKNSILKNYLNIKNIIDNKHILVIEKILKKINQKVSIIGLHGQTFFHEPSSGWTWQYINASHIAQKFKINVVSDFRIADVNNGGEGAPLVPLFHRNLLISKISSFPFGVLNLGGVSNITIIKNSYDFIGFDTGPGNGPLDLLIGQRLKFNMDKNGDLAKTGKVNNLIKKKTLDLLSSYLKRISFDRKTLDEKCLAYMGTLNTNDALATLVDIITDIISLKLRNCNLKKIIVVGGGRKNKSLLLSLKNKINIKVLTSEQFGLDGDSIEAEAFAYLAVKSLLGEPYTFKNTTGIKKECSGGVLYYFRSY